MDEILKTLLPTAATLFAGPAAGFAVKFLAEKLGVQEATQEAVTGALQNLTSSPEDRMKLAQIDAELRAKAMETGIDLEKAYLADVQDARKRDTAITLAGGHNWRSDILAFLAVGGLIICVYFIARDGEIQERAVNAIMFVAGVLASAVRDVYGFEFGSSRSSRDKDDAIKRLMK